jgi:hypothetical protein
MSGIEGLICSGMGAVDTAGASRVYDNECVCASRIKESNASLLSRSRAS